MDTFHISTRDKIFAALCCVGALAILFSLVYAMTRIVNVWFPVGCVR